MKKELGQSQANQFLNRSGNSNQQQGQGNVVSPNLPQFIQIKNWVAQLNNKKILRAQRNDIMNIVQQLGSEGNQYLLECLLESLDMNSQNSQNKANLHTTVKGQFLSQHLHDLIFSNSFSNFLDFMPNVFIKVVCGPNSFQSQTNTKQLNSVVSYAQELSKCLKMNLVDQLFIALGFACCNNETVASDGVKLLREKIIDFVQQQNQLALPQNNLPVVLLQFVLQNPELKNMSQEIVQLKQILNDPKNKEIKPLIYGRDNYDDDNSQGSEEIQDPDLHKEVNYPKPEDINHIIGPADILKDLGPSALSSIDNLVRSLQQFPKWTNSDVYQCLELIAQDPVQLGEEANQRLANNILQVESKNSQQEWGNFTNQEQSDKNSQGDWNAELFIEFLQKKIFPQNSELNWVAVLVEIDRPNLKLKDEKSFKQFFVNMQLIHKKAPFQMPAYLLLKPWKNIRSQALFFKNMLAVGSSELVRWNEIQKNPMNLEFNPQYKYNQLPSPMQFWACLDFLDLLCEISEGDNFMAVHELFEVPIAKYPDILIVALSQLHPKKGANLLDEVFSQLFPNYLSNHINSVAILEAIWKNREDLLISAISELYRKENKKENTSLNLSRVLDISQYLKDSLIALTNSNNYAFSVSLGILAGKREFLHFDQWLNERVKTVGDPFVNALLAYIEDNVIIPIKEINSRINNGSNQQQYEGVLEKAQLTIELLTIIFESLLLEQFPEKLTSKNRQKLQEQYKEVLTYFPQLSGTQDSPGQATEKKANYNFQRFYVREITIEEMIANLKQLMNSNNSEDREVFACMITSLIEEAKYHQQYPIPELLLTGQLQGSIINAQLVNQKPLGIMLEQILESSKKTQRQVDQAVKAIEAMKDRLHEFPNFVNALFDSSCHLSEQNPQLLINIYNLMNEKKVQISVTSKQIDQLKQRVEALKNEANKPAAQQQAGTQPEKQKKILKIRDANERNATENNTPQQSQNNQQAQNQSAAVGSAVGQFDQLSAQQNLQQQQQQQQEASAQAKQQQEQEAKSNNDINNQPRNASTQNASLGEEKQPSDNTTQNKGKMKKMLNAGSSVFPLSNLNQNQPKMVFENPMNQQIRFQDPSIGMYDQSLYNNNNNTEEIVLKARPYQGGVGFVQRPIFTDGEQQIYVSKSINEILEYENSLQIEDNIKMRVNFALNNLSDGNIEKHQNDFRNYAENENFQRWFARHLVTQRATLKSEINVLLYTKLCERLDKPKLFTYIIKDSLLLLHKLLLSEAQIHASIRITTLKNLAHWIGMFTLNRNKPIQIKYLNIKALIISSYPNKIDVIIPIVINILLCCKESKIFNPQTNRWVKRILSLLEEFKNVVQKETVKHQINQLFSNLQIDVNSLEPCTYFRYYLQESKKEAKPAPQPATIVSSSIRDRLIITDDLRNLCNIQNFNLKQAVFQSLDEAIMEIIQPVISRSVTIALVTTRELVLKDHCTDPDENNLINGISNMVQKLSGCLALITCKDPLRSSFQTHLKTNLEKVNELNPNEKDQIVNKVVSDNIDIGCQEIRQRVMDQALKDIKQDDAILEAIEMRRAAKEKQQVFVDERYYKFTKNLPLALQPKFPNSSAYAEFDRTSLNNDNLISEYNSQTLESFKKIVSNFSPEQPENIILTPIEGFFKKLMFSDKLYNELIDLIFQMMYQCEVSTKIRLYVEILDKLREQHKGKDKIGKLLKDSLMNNAPLDNLIKTTLHTILNSLFIKKIITNKEYQEIMLLLVSRNQSNDMIICLVSALRELIFDKKEYTPQDFNDSIIALKLTMSSKQDIPPHYSQFLQDLNRITSENNNNQNNIITFERALDVITNFYGNFDKKQYEEIQEKVEKWLSLSTEGQIGQYIQALVNNIFDNHDENSLKFFVYFADICINYSLESGKKNKKNNIQNITSMDFTCVDCFTKLIEIIQKTFKIEYKKQLLNQIFDSIFITLTKYHETDMYEFNQRPFFRIFFNLIYDNQRPKYDFSKNEISETYSMLANIFHQLSPVKYPGFAFSWLELISNRYFMPVIMEKEELWGLYSQLIIDLIKFFKEIMQEENLQLEYIKIFYRGTIRILLVLLHDWPDFLAKYSNSLCDEIPENYIQIRNIILAAFPKTMKPPDPFSNKNEQIFENNEDFKNPPVMDYPVYNEKIQVDLMNDLQNYLRTKSEDIFKTICSKLTLKEKSQFVIDQKAVNVLILAIPLHLYKQSANSGKEIKTIPLNNDLYNFLLKLLKTSHYEMREVILNLIINQVRYPNFITKFYIKYILLTFQEQNINDIQEQTLRIIVERLFVQKPHPWGIIYTFIEIIKSNTNFRSKPFVRDAELKQVFRFIYQEPPRQRPPQQQQQQPQQQQIGQHIQSQDMGAIDQQMHINSMSYQMIQQQQQQQYQQQQQQLNQQQQIGGAINPLNYVNYRSK